MFGVSTSRELLRHDAAAWCAAVMHGHALCINTVLGAADQAAPPPALPRVPAASAVNTALAFSHLLASMLHAFAPRQVQRAADITHDPPAQRGAGRSARGDARRRGAKQGVLRAGLTSQH
jgi:hypothetical protein